MSHEITMQVSQQRRVIQIFLGSFKNSLVTFDVLS